MGSRKWEKWEVGKVGSGKWENCAPAPFRLPPSDFRLQNSECQKSINLTQENKINNKDRYDLDQAELLSNKDATRRNILRKLDELSSKVKPADKLIIYFPGHGYLQH